MSVPSFEEASIKIQASLDNYLAKKTHLKNDDGSSTDSEEDSVDANDDGRNAEIISRIYATYDKHGQPGEDCVSSRTVRAIEGAVTQLTCLICISSIKPVEAVWNCVKCFTALHITCIQRWARDSIFQQKNEEHFDDFSHLPPSSIRGNRRDKARSFEWVCPKCRNGYTENEIPQRYLCYCGKRLDPPMDPWVIPHSCGEMCGKPLEPACGHQCVILCHPGPCPPCPKIVKSYCYCEQSAPSTRRCYEKEWSCRRPCSRQLSCLQHTCPLPCHKSACPPCQKTSVQLCLCQRSQNQRFCSDAEWRCQEICKKPLQCGHHNCDVICHKGQCPPCPLSQLRHCPCGKTSHVLDCTIATPTCGNTCGRVLSCKNHFCSQRCHRGACGPCLHTTMKTCRCGAKKQEILCSKEFVCNSKCRQIRNCGRHTCNRKCCEANSKCPPCEQVCGKSLACKNHKCQSRCHVGPCFPCSSNSEVSCFCGNTRILVPCGIERTTEPPRCKNKCVLPSDCHHSKRQKHPCHFGSCPKCTFPCNLIHQSGCGHKCPLPCHDNVVVSQNLQDQKTDSFFRAIHQKKTMICKIPCPPCEFPVSLDCPGGHETRDYPCHSSSRALSCGRVCGRLLRCGNHTCDKECHRLKESGGSSCRRCFQGCVLPRDCPHPCSLKCHPEPCPPCSQVLRIWCHCGIEQMYLTCWEWFESANKPKREQLKSCKDQCHKLLDCGHRCSKTCHSDECSPVSQCRKKVKLYCPCKRIKREVQCQSRNTKEFMPQCDSECDIIKKQVSLIKMQQNKSESEEVERLQREEVRRFEKQTQGIRGSRRNRKDKKVPELEIPFWFKHKFAVGCFAVVLTSMTAYILYFKILK